MGKILSSAHVHTTFCDGNGLEMAKRYFSLYRNMTLEALRAMRETNALLEVNTGGVARGYMTRPYPSEFLLKEWKAWGGEVIVNSDCHNVKLLDAGYLQAEEILLSLGFDYAVRLSSDPTNGMWEQFGLR